MKILPSIVLIFIFAFSVCGRWNSEIRGKASDLAGKTKVYLKARTTKSSEIMVKVLQKENLFEVVSEARAADFVLEYIEYTLLTKSSSLGKRSEVGDMSAYFINGAGQRVVAWRQIKDKYQAAGWGWKRKETEELLAAEFIKAYKGK